MTAASPAAEGRDKSQQILAATKKESGSGGDERSTLTTFAGQQQRRDRGILGHSSAGATRMAATQAQPTYQPQVVDPAGGRMMYFGARPVPSEYCGAWYPGGAGEDYSLAPNYYYPGYAPTSGGRETPQFSTAIAPAPPLPQNDGGDDNFAHLIWMVRSEIVEFRSEFKDDMKDVIDDVRELKQEIAKLRKALGVEGNCCPKCAAWMIRDQSVRTPSAMSADGAQNSESDVASAKPPAISALPPPTPLSKETTMAAAAAVAEPEAPKLDRHDSWADEMEAEDAKLRETPNSMPASGGTQEEEEQQTADADVIPGESSRSRRRRLRKQQQQQQQQNATAEGEEPPPLRLYPETPPQQQQPCASRFLVRHIERGAQKFFRYFFDNPGQEEEDHREIFEWKTEPPFDPQTRARDMELAQTVAAVMLESEWSEMSTDEIAVVVERTGGTVGEKDRADFLRGLDKVLMWMCSISAVASVRSGTKWKLKISDVQHLRYNINMGCLT